MRKCCSSVSRTVTEMRQKLQLCVFMTLIQVSFAVWQRVTAIRGQTVDLSCPITNPHQTTVDWKTPDGKIMFFVDSQGVASHGVASKRYSLKKLSASQFTVSISDVTVKDGGNYTCSHYDHHVTEKTVEMMVLDRPKIIRRKYKERFDQKCTARASHAPPQIIWKLGDGPEILAQSQVIQEDKTYMSSSILSLQAVEEELVVACLIHHPAPDTPPLVDFIKIRPKKNKLPYTTSSPTYPHQTTRQPTAPPSTQGRTPPASTEVPTSSNHSVHDNATTSGRMFTSSNDTVQHPTSTEGGYIDPNMQSRHKGRSPLLVILVTSLICALLVVVIFFAIKLRRAHLIWKKENEESDPSEESSKSKSSQEDKKGQGQNSRGVIKTMFTQYVVEEPAAPTSVINTGAMVSEGNATQEQPLPSNTSQTAVTVNTKETDL